MLCEVVVQHFSRLACRQIRQLAARPTSFEDFLRRLFFSPDRALE